MSYSIYTSSPTDIGQRTPAAQIPLAWIYVVPLVGFILDGAARGPRGSSCGHPSGPRPRRGRRMSLALLLLLIFGLFLLRVPDGLRDLRPVPAVPDQ